MVTQYGMSEALGAVKFGQESGEVFLGRDMGHQRDYSEEVAAQVDAEVRGLVENAHHEAWEILVEYRDVLDEMVLRLLDKETLTKDEVAEVFAPVAKRPARQHPTANGRRPLSKQAPGAHAGRARRDGPGRPRRPGARPRKPRPARPQARRRPQADPVRGPATVNRQATHTEARAQAPRPSRRQAGTDPAS